ncbi:MAG: helix-turn-helix transcriptional regulator [Desulfuromonadales bacterium]|nr:helix-turn-helix transcriptional regulator [Desulfuromonadales bacterium]
MQLQRAFGKILKNLRTEASFSQETLALECGLDRTYISLLERGLRQPSLKTIFTLSRSLKVSPSVLVSLVEKELI